MKPSPPNTTGKTAFAEIRDFCREQKRGLSAKKTFAESGSRQTPAVGNWQDCRGPASRQSTALGEVGRFAESCARQKMPVGKTVLCRRPPSRQNQALGKTLPRPIAVTCPDGVTALPRASPLLLSANLFAERRSRQIFAESPSQALGKGGFYISCACVSLLLTLSN